MTTRARCTVCGETVVITGRVGGDDELWQHNTAHRYGGEEIHQLGHVSFLAEYIAWVSALPIGTEFTTADAHGKIPDPPSANHWGRAQVRVGELGLSRPIETQRSELTTTKGSRLLRHVRIAQERRAVA